MPPVVTGDTTQSISINQTRTDCTSGDSLMSRIQNLLQVSQDQVEGVNESITKLDESLSMLDTEKRIEELKALAAVVDKQFVDLLAATNNDDDQNKTKQLSG